MRVDVVQKKSSVVLHQGVFKPVASTTDAVFMVTGMTIGAGILGLPYAVARVGIIPGVLAIIALGLVMLGLNLMIGEVAVRTGDNLQLPGLAGRYVGPWAKAVVALTIVSSGYGALLAYVVGEGQALSALLGGSPVMWSVVFWSVGSFLIWGGLQRIKIAERFFSAMVIAIITGIALYLLPHFQVAELYHTRGSELFLPLGVILFALHSTPAVAEAHALLPQSTRRFRRALIWGAVIPIAVYALFSLAVVGVSGFSTTPIASVGLGARFGTGMILLANLFAVFAMSTGFMGLGTALKESFIWDYKIPPFVAQVMVVAVPVTLFLAGWRNFIQILDVVGGLFIAVEGAMMTVVYLRARRYGQMRPGASALTHPWIVAIPTLLFFVIVIGSNVYSLIR